MITIANTDLTVEISPLGAELQSVTSADGRSWLWHGDPAFWSGRAPILFPVIGKSPKGQASIEGRSYPMDGHGFARVTDFEVVETSDTRCAMRMRDSTATRRSFPFAFELELSFELIGKTLSAEASVTNRDDRTMPFCFGFHPAFAWPLPGAEGSPHIVRLDNRQDPALLQIDADALLKPGSAPSPFDRGMLTLAPALFENGALIFDADAGDGLWYGAEGIPGIKVDFAEMPQLGLWTKPGAPFLCIEPWHGLPAPAGVQEPLEKRRGVISLEPGRSTSLSMRTTFGAE